VNQERDHTLFLGLEIHVVGLGVTHEVSHPYHLGLHPSFFCWVVPHAFSPAFRVPDGNDDGQVED